MVCEEGSCWCSSERGLGPERVRRLNVFSLLLEELGAEGGYVLAAVGPGRGAVVSVGGLGVKFLPPLCSGGSILLCLPC